MERSTNETVNDLIKSFNKSGSFSAFKSIDDDVENFMWSENSLNFEEKAVKSKYWTIVKNHIAVACFFGRKKKSSKTKKNKNETPKENQKAKSKLPQRTEVYLPEKEWFIKKFEREIGKPLSENIFPLATFEKDIKHRVTYEKENRLYQKYKEPPRPDYVPDIAWDGPLLKCCFCMSTMDNCDCRGDMVLPPRIIPKAISKKNFNWLHYLQWIPYFTNLQPPIPELPERPFAQRLQDHLETEALVQNQLKELEPNRGPEFCVFRCYHYYRPGGYESGRYFKLKRDLYNKYKKIQRQPTTALGTEERLTAPTPVPNLAGPTIADEFIDGLYRSVSTQGTTDEDGEFVMGDVSHILFGRGDASVLQDIEGTPYCVCSYQDIVKIKSQTVVRKIENLLSVSGIKKRVSKLTSNLMSSIVEIKDPGIPINTRATQDPSLDNYFESIIVPSKYKFLKEIKDVSPSDVCPCCKKYKQLNTVETERIGSNIINNNERFISKGVDFLLNDPFSSGIGHIQDELKSYNGEGLKQADNVPKVATNRQNFVTEKFQKQMRQSGSIDNDNLNIVGKPVFLNKNKFSETKNHDENRSNLKSINNIEPLKRNLITNKLIEKYMGIDQNKNLYAIQSESIINTEDVRKIMVEKNSDEVKSEPKKKDIVTFKGMDKKHKMNSLEFLESIKPCCIDNLYKQLEMKISNEKYIIKLLKGHIFRRVNRIIYSIEKKRQQEIENIKKLSNKTSDNQLIEENKNLLSDNIDLVLDKAKDQEIESADSWLKKSKIFNSIKSSINIKKFSNFIKKQKSSLKKFFTKNIKDDHLISKTRKALSLENFKVKINKSLKKINNTLSSFFKRHSQKLSNDIKQFLPINNNTDKVDSLDDSVSKSADHFNDNTLQNKRDTSDSKTSEKEVFSVQYNSTCAFYSKNNNQ